MIFFPNATIYIAELTTVKNSEGTKIKTYNFENPILEFRADVQPNNLSEYQRQLYGINAKTAETKRAFFDSEEYIKIGTRAKVVEDDGTTRIYDVQPINKWRLHSEVLLIPVEN